MRKPPKSKEFIELAEIRAILKKEFTLRLNTRSGIYYYIKTGGFPLPVGLGRPRKWERAAVMDWVTRQAKKA